MVDPEQRARSNSVRAGAVQPMHFTRLEFKDASGRSRNEHLRHDRVIIRKFAPLPFTFCY
jgi:hypothetical protein